MRVKFVDNTIYEDHNGLTLGKVYEAGEFFDGGVQVLADDVGDKSELYTGEYEIYEE